MSRRRMVDAVRRWGHGPVLGVFVRRAWRTGAAGWLTAARAAFGQADAHGVGQHSRVAGEAFAVLRVDRELHPVTLAERSQHGVPVFAWAGAQFRRDDARHCRHPVARASGQ